MGNWIEQVNGFWDQFSSDHFGGDEADSWDEATTDSAWLVKTPKFRVDLRKMSEFDQWWHQNMQKAPVQAQQWKKNFANYVSKYSKTKPVMKKPVQTPPPQLAKAEKPAQVQLNKVKAPLRRKTAATSPYVVTASVVSVLAAAGLGLYCYSSKKKVQ